jgi:tight adherence protein B
MLSASTFPVAMAVLGTVSVGGLLLALLQPHLSRGAKLNKRVLAITGAGPAIGRQSATAEESHRRKSVEDTLRDAEEKRKADLQKRNRPSLTMRLRQADLRWSKRTYLAICAGVGAAVFFTLLLLSGLASWLCLAFALGGGVLGPHMYVGLRRNRRLRRFSNEFPNAVDVVVRGVKSGLPLVDCLKIVATEAQEPVRSEFKTLVEDQTLGLPLDEAVQRLPERMPVSEARFFAIVIAIQSRTGGSLSEALGNLSKVLRDRRKMQAKIKSMSSEAKASAGIIGALPVMVTGLIYVTTPAYIALLFTTSIGHLVIGACALWMLIGVLVMRKMINFDF